MRTTLILAAAVAAVGCAEPQMAAEPTLYDRLGGMPAINVVVDDFTAKMAADPRVNGTFANTDIPNFKRLLAEQICDVSGGPCTYSGRSMEDAHRGMNITTAQFNLSGQYLSEALTENGVTDPELTEVLTVVGSLQDQIVGQ